MPNSKESAIAFCKSQPETRKMLLPIPYFKEAISGNKVLLLPDFVKRSIKCLHPAIYIQHKLNLHHLKSEI